MTRDHIFKAKLSQLLLEFGLALIAGIALVAWQGKAIKWIPVVAMAGYLIYRLFITGAAIKTVRLNDDGLEIVPLFP